MNAEIYVVVRVCGGGVYRTRSYFCVSLGISRCLSVLIFCASFSGCVVHYLGVNFFNK